MNLFTQQLFRSNTNQACKKFYSNRIVTLFEKDLFQFIEAAAG